MSTPAMKTTTIQLSEDLLAELRSIAKAEGRSLAAQVRLFLARAVTRPNTASRKKPLLS